MGSYKSRIKKDESLNVCVECGTTPHDVKHLFICPAHPTTMIPSGLWSRPTDTVRNSAISRRDTQIEMNMDWKASNNNWTQFTEDTEPAFAQTTIPPLLNIHTANLIFTNIILLADPRGNKTK